MKCAACQFENPDGMAFCGKCGKPMAPVCPKCGFEAPAGMAFCGKCGTPLFGEAPQAEPGLGSEAEPGPAASVTRRDELKTITVLFADVKGSTTMGERLPPDEVKDIMNDCLGLLEEEILKQDGHIDKYLGDGLMALFGAPISHENDPERAVSAALDMQDRVRKYARKVQKRAGTLLEMRVGINTGKVLAGHIGKKKADYTVMGDAVNLASRLESMATPGKVQISHDTYRHVRKKFNCEPKGPLKVKGLVREVKAYEVIGRKEDESLAFSFEVAGVRPKMTGRDTEMRILQETLDRATAEKLPKLVTVFGSRGVGKSRLIYEFTDHILGQSRAAMISTARCVGTSPHSYWLISELIKEWIGAARATNEEFRERFLSTVKGLDEKSATETAHFVAALIGVPFPDSPHTKPYESDPKMMQQIAFKCLSTLFGRAGARQPVILIAEDINHADTGSLEALLYLSMAVENAGLLVIATAREEEFEAKDMFSRDLPNLATIRLKPLDKNACLILLDEMFSKVSNVPPQYKESIAQKTEGNPYYVEEILKDLVDREVIAPARAEDGSATWAMAKVGEGLGVPQTLEGLVQTRVDRVPFNQKILLQEASSIGKDFWESVLGDIEEASGPATFEGEPEPVSLRIKELEGKDFAYRKPVSRFTDELQHAFKHSFMQEVVYGSIPTKMRRGFHSVIAAWLTEKSKDSVEQYSALLAHHYEQAGEPKKACEEYLAAGETSKRLHDNKEAIAMYEKVLDLVDEVELDEEDKEAAKAIAETVKEAQTALGELYLVTGNFAASEKIYQALFETCPDGSEKAEALVCLGRVDESSGQYAEALEHYSQAEEQLAGLAEGEAVQIHVNILRGRVFVHMRRGENDDALDFANQALETFSEYESAAEDKDKNMETVAATMNTMGLTYQQKGDLDTAMETFEMALEEYRGIGNKRGEGMVLNNIGIIHYSRGNMDEAEKFYARSRDMSHEIGDIQGRANAIANIGLIHQSEYRYQNAVEELESALEIRRRMGDRGGIANSLINIAIVYLYLGCTSEAKKVLDQVDEMCRAEENPTWRWYEAFCRGELSRLEGDPKAAMEFFAKARELAQSMNNIMMEGPVLQSMTEVLLGMKDYVKACEAGSQARSIFEKTGDEKATFGIRLYEIEGLIGAGETDHIEKDLRECGETAKKFPGDRDMLFRYNVLTGRFKEGQGDTEGARAHYREAIQIKEAIASELKDPDFRKSYMNRPEVKELSEALRG